MAELTISIPNVGTRAIFKFKEPFRSFVKNKFRHNTDGTQMEVASIINMKDNVVNDARDPYSEIYDPAGITQDEYKKDVIDNISIITLRFRDNKDVVRYIRVPANYISEISDTGTVEYISKMLVIDLGMLPVDLDVAKLSQGLTENISYLIGVRSNNLPKIHEVGIGDIELVPYEEHVIREEVRSNIVQHKDNLIASEAYYKMRLSQLVDTLRAKDIVVQLPDI